MKVMAPLLRTSKSLRTMVRISGFMFSKIGSSPVRVGLFRLSAVAIAVVYGVSSFAVREGFGQGIEAILEQIKCWELPKWYDGMKFMYSRCRILCAARWFAVLLLPSKY